MIDAVVGFSDRRGFDAVAIDEIVEPSQVSPRTFLRYFGCKDAELFHDFDVMLDVLRIPIEGPRPRSAALRVLRIAVLALGDQAAQDLDSQTRRAQVVRDAAQRTSYTRPVLQPACGKDGGEAMSPHLGVSVDRTLRPARWPMAASRP
jgi:AcrR family transcriptional regulator